MSRIGQGSGLAAPTHFEGNSTGIGGGASKLRRPTVSQGQQPQAASEPSSQSRQLGEPKTGLGRQQLLTQSQRPTETAAKPTTHTGASGTSKKQSTASTGAHKSLLQKPNLKSQAQERRQTFLSKGATEETKTTATGIQRPKAKASGTGLLTSVSTAQMATTQQSKQHILSQPGILGLQPRKQLLAPSRSAATNKEPASSGTFGLSRPSKIGSSGIQKPSTTQTPQIKQEKTPRGTVSMRHSTALPKTAISGLQAPSSSGPQVGSRPSTGLHSRKKSFNDGLQVLGGGVGASKSLLTNTGSSSGAVGGNLNSRISRIGRGHPTQSNTKATQDQDSKLSSTATKIASSKPSLSLNMPPSRDSNGQLKSARTVSQTQVLIAETGSRLVQPRASYTGYKQHSSSTSQMSDKVTPAYSVSLTGSGQGAAQSSSPKKRPSGQQRQHFDLKTPQRTQMQPPKPIESVSNPSLIVDRRSEEATHTEVINLHHSKLVVKYREAPAPTGLSESEEDAPLPQSNTAHQTSPIKKPINSAQRQIGPAANSLGTRQSKLAEIRQRKTLLMHKQQDPLVKKTQFELQIAPTTPLALQESQSQVLRDFNPGLSPKADFTQVTSQLSEIQSQLQLQSARASSRLVVGETQMVEEISFEQFKQEQDAQVLEAYQDHPLTLHENSPDVLSNPTPIQERTSILPQMAEPDICPFDRAALSCSGSSNNGGGGGDQSADSDLLADLPGDGSSSENRRNTHHSGSRTRMPSQPVLTIGDLAGSYRSSLQSNRSAQVQQDLAPRRQSEDSQGEANVSLEEESGDDGGRHSDKAQIHQIGSQYNLTRGIRKPTESAQLEQAKTFEYRKFQSATEPDQEASMLTMLQSSQGNGDQNFDSGRQSSSRIVQRRAARFKNQSQTNLGDNGGVHPHHKPHGSSSFTRQLKDLDLESKIKNLQDSISHLPSRVVRPSSKASRRKTQARARARAASSLSQTEGEGADETTVDDVYDQSTMTLTSDQVGGSLGLFSRLRNHRQSMPATFESSQDKAARNQRFMKSQNDTPFDVAEISMPVQDAYADEGGEDDLLLSGLDEDVAVQDKFQRSHGAFALSQQMMIEEVDLEEEEVNDEETKFVPPKLEEMRRQQKQSLQSNDHRPVKNSLLSKYAQQKNTKSKQSSTRTSALRASQPFPSSRQKLSGPTQAKKTAIDTLPSAPPKRTRLDTLALPKTSTNGSGARSSQQAAHEHPSARHQFKQTSKIEESKRTVQPHGATSADSFEALLMSQSLNETLGLASKTSSSLAHHRNTIAYTAPKRAERNTAKQRTSDLIKVSPHTAQQKKAAVFDYSARRASQPTRFNDLSKPKPQSRPQLRPSRLESKAKKISKIALYKDQQPIIGLRKRPFNQTVQERHSRFDFAIGEDFRPEEHPIADVSTIECPICKRSFTQGVFAEIHNANDLCRRVFVGKRVPFDPQKYRLGEGSEMAERLSVAKQSINFMQRVKLNEGWQAKRDLFQKHATLHRRAFKGKIVDKMPMPVVYDPEDPEGSVMPREGAQIIGDQQEHQQEHQLFTADLSMIEAPQRTRSEIAGLTVKSNSLLEPLEAQGLSGIPEVAPDGRIPCDYCGRKFAPDVSLKHVPICQRNYEKKHGPGRKPKRPV